MDSELRDFLEGLDKIPWFHNVGKPILSEEVKQVFSWSKAWECLNDDTWTYASFHDHVDSTNPAWDIGYDKAEQAVSKSTFSCDLDEDISVADAAAYDAAGAASEIATGSKDRFFVDLMHWYRLGHWPCGWDGKYPEGRLIVY